MFKKLRNHFILINLATTSFILIAAFSCVYIVAKNSSDTRRPIPTEINIEEYSDQNIRFRQFMEERIIADREASLRSLLITLIATGIAVEIIVAIFSYIFAEQAIKPVKNAYETQKIFIANASHEIKTPVAAIKANLEAADLSDKNHWIKNIEVEADKIETLNLALLRLAKTDAIQETLSIEEFDIKRTISSVISSFSPRIKQNNIILKKDIIDKKIKLNRADLKEITEILLDNAIKYCKKSIRITVSTRNLSITNDGTTIPKDKLPHIFDRFYQVDKSSPGSGLGLAIANSLAKRNHWTLKASSEHNQTTFELIF